jgi:23S rRNA (cytidine2498-2'-O)-methyltransferase
VFALCQRGAEPALKRELARVQPSWRAAFQQPGLVTFKTPAPIGAEVRLASVFARAHGASLGMAASVQQLAAGIAELPVPLRLHVVESDRYRPDEEPTTHVSGAAADQVEQTLRTALPATFRPGSRALPGELVLNVIVVAEDSWLLGLHVHERGRCPHPGGRYPIEVPAEAPSRAFAKIEEAIAHFALPFRSGDVALEIGASPGGAAYALLRRGISVIGVDPGACDPHVLSFEGPARAHLSHHAVPIAALQRAQLPEHVDWLLLDVHLAPQIALRAAKRVASWFRAELSGAVLTLKLNDWSFADDIDGFLQQTREMGLFSPAAKQLASHRQELAIAGLTQRGAARKKISAAG